MMSGMGAHQLETTMKSPWKQQASVPGSSSRVARGGPLLLYVLFCAIYRVALPVNGNQFCGAEVQALGFKYI